jgi:adenylate cyclase class IV
MIEVELKAHIEDRAAVEARVAAFAILEGPVDKLDAYWHGPDWRIARGKKGFRVRAEDGKSVVTFKNKKTEGGIEINREREFGISDPEAFVEFAQRLGCEPFYTKRKRGVRYRVDPCDRGAVGEDTGKAGCEGATTIEIVDVEGLGGFIEIEVLLADEEPAAVALAQGEIRGFLARSGVASSAIEPRYYSELLMEAGLVKKP